MPLRKGSSESTFLKNLREAWASARRKGNFRGTPISDKDKIRLRILAAAYRMKRESGRRKK
jgi:hypothetical protein